MQPWSLFSDPRFPFQFNYPSVATDGEPVDVLETQEEGRIRVHILAQKSREVYFEVTKYASLSARDEYEIHKDWLQKQFSSLVISSLNETLFASLPAYEYRFEWEQGTRVVILVERDNATYRIIYSPRFPVNKQILSTLLWYDLP